MLQHTCPREAGTSGDRGAVHAPFASTHVPARGGHLSATICWIFCASFNTRARARRAPASFCGAASVGTLQHTCPREAGTGAGIPAPSGERASTHVPARGGHFTDFSMLRPFPMLQHTCPREAGTSAIKQAQQDRTASTHVPARGGHIPHANTNAAMASFNTRARARRALDRLIVIRGEVWLQHTCPREAGTLLKCCFVHEPVASTHVPARGGH